MTDYLLAGHLSEVERLRMQSEVWEPVGRGLLEQFGPGAGRRAVDLGCGPLGWLRILTEAGWETTGTDVQPAMLDAAAELGTSAQLVEDEVFASALPPAHFDLVHARFLLGRAAASSRREGRSRRCSLNSGSRRRWPLRSLRFRTDIRTCVCHSSSRGRCARD